MTPSQQAKAAARATVRECWKAISEKHLVLSSVI